jgi:phage-type endonuclease
MTAVQISHEQWLKARQTGIGGSDVAPILGISKWTTPLDVYNEKVADTPTEKDSDPMEWGRRLEPVIRQAYAESDRRRG